MEEQNFDIVAAVKQLVEDYGHLANEIAEVKASIYDNLINPIKGENIYEGDLINVNDDSIQIQYKNKTRSIVLEIAKSNIYKIRLAIKF